jgi:N,N'-diacetyllegionaminate synthase
MKSTFIIAEIAQAHDGSLGLAHSYIDVLAKTGVDAVKFQTHIADAESSQLEKFRVNFSYEDETRFDYWKRMEFTFEQWLDLKNHCEILGLEFMSSPFSCAAVDWLEKLNVKRYKIGSGEVSNYLMLDKIARTGKEIILSSGMSNYDELRETISFLKPYNVPLQLLQCTTAYPNPPEKWNLQEIPKLKKEFEIPVGFSDHSADITACIAAKCMGAETLEFHVVFDKEMFGPDAKASLTLKETKKLVKSIRALDKSFASGQDKSDNSMFSELKIMFGKSLSVNKNLLKNHILTIEDLESKKPGDAGIPCTHFQNVIGKKINKNMNQWDFLKTEDIDV